MKNNKKINNLLIVVIISCIVIIISILILRTKEEKHIGQNILAIMENQKTEEVVAKVQNEKKEILEITNKDIECYKIFNASHDNINKEIIENKAMSIEAQNRNIKISQEELDRIRGLSKDNEVLGKIQEKDKEKVGEIIYQNLLDINYTTKLKEQILEEIQNNNLSIEDEKLNVYETEYVNLQEQAKQIKNENEKKEMLQKIYQKLIQIQELYYSKIVDKYIIK